MTKEEVEQAFNGLSPYYAYKQGLQEGAAYNEESFRREAAKDILAGMMSNPEKISLRGVRLATIDEFVCAAIEITDELIRQLKEK